MVKETAHEDEDQDPSKTMEFDQADVDEQTARQDIKAKETKQSKNLFQTHAQKDNTLQVPMIK